MIVGFTHKHSDVGGPGSFQSRLESRLIEDGHIIVYAPSELIPDVILVVGGSRRLLWLFLKKLRGSKIVHRLDGRNWQHSIASHGIFRFLKSRLANTVMSFIRLYLADEIIYQSNFVKSIWEKRRLIRKKYHVVYNSVPTDIFFPHYKETTTCSPLSTIICVEGEVNGPPALTMLKSIEKYNIDVYGAISKILRFRLEKLGKNNLHLKGIVPREEVPFILMGKKIFLNLETNPACPNSIIEAMSAGVPVIGFDSGSLKELVGDAGIVLPYGEGKPWSLESPDCSGLEDAIGYIDANYHEFSQKARARAITQFDIEIMYKSYLKILVS